MKYKLFDLLEFKTQGVNTTTDHIMYVNKGYKIVQAKNIAPYNITFDENNFIDEDTFSRIKDNHKLHKGEVLYTNIGSQLGNSAIYEFDNEAIITWNVMKLIPNKNLICNYYLCYLLNFNKPYIKALNTSSTMPFVSGKELMNVEFDAPDLQTQRKIVKILKSIEDKIKLNNKINNNLYEEAVALYKDKFKGIGQGKKTIGDYIVPKRGKNLLTRDAIDGDTPVVAGGIAPSAYHNQFNTKSPVITISASGANAGYTNLWNIPVWASDCSYIDDSITKNVYFWYIVLKTRQNEIFDAQTGSAQPHIYPQHIAEMSIGELNIAKVEKYNNLVAPLFKMIGENQNENKKLSQLRDTLLPKLMNGEIDLDNIEI